MELPLHPFGEDHQANNDPNIPQDKTVHRRIALLAALSTCSMVLGVTCVMPILPLLANQFQVPLTSMSLAIIVYTLPGIFFTPLAGILADKYGRKIVLVPSFILFCLAGGACAFAKDFTVFIALRFIQGVGAAPLGVLNTTILGDTFSGNSLTKAVGYNMSLLSLTSALYPALSGFLAQIQWNIPLMLPFLSLPAIIVAIYSPLRGAGAPLSFSKYLANVKQAISSQTIAKLLLVTFLIYVMLYGPIITCYPILVHNKFDASPALIGFAMMFYSISSGIMASQFAFLSLKFPKKSLLILSLIFYAIALTCIPIMHDILLIFPFLAIYGIGQGLNTSNIQATLIQNTEANDRASVMAVNGMLLRLGQTLSPLLFTFIIESQGITTAFWSALLIPLLIYCLIRKSPSPN